MVNRFINAVVHYLSSIQGQLFFILLITLIVAIIFVIFIILLVKYSKGGAPKPAPSPKKPPVVGSAKNEEKPDEQFATPPFLFGFSEFLTSFKKFRGGEFSSLLFNAHKFLKRTYPGINYKYNLPWVLVLGPAQSGKTQLITTLENELGVASPDFYQESPRMISRWSFFSNAVTVNLKGDFLLENNKNNVTEKTDGWRTLLTLLSRYRSKRPLNSIVLVLSLEDIYGAKALPDGEIAKRARIISNKIRNLQDYLGLQVPIYVLLSKLDIIPGFKDFTTTLSDEQKQDIFGWSSPHAADTSYSGHLFTEAFEYIQNKLKRNIYFFLTKSKGWEQSSGLYIFQKEYLKIREKLEIYINAIFAHDDLHREPIFRGLYFTGAKNQADLFVTNLFQNKIFKEQGMMVPLKNHFRNSQKTIRKIQVVTAVFAVVASLGFLHSYKKLNDKREKIVPVLWNMNSLFDRMQSLPIGDRQKMRLIYDESLQQLIYLSHHTKGTSFFSFFIPASWFSHSRRELDVVLNRTTQLILIRSLYFDLLLKTKDVLSIKPRKIDQSESLGELLIPTASREFKLLRNFIQNVTRLHDNVLKFNRLKYFHDPNILDDLFQYAFQAKLPCDFIMRYGKIDKYLSSNLFPPIDLSVYEKEFRKVLSVIYQNYFNALFDPNTPDSLISRMGKLMKELDPKNPKAIPDFNEMQRIQISLNNAVPRLGEEGKTWLDQSYFNPGATFTEVLSAISHLDMYGQNITQYLVDQTHVGFERARGVFSKFNDFLTLNVKQGKDLCAQPGKSGAISSGIFAFQKSLDLILNQPYIMSEHKDTLSANLANDEISFWDMDSISSVTQQMETHNNFLGKEFQKIPVTLQDKFRKLLRSGFNNYLLYSLSRAQIVEKKLSPNMPNSQLEAYLVEKTDLLNNLSPKLISILEFMNTNNLGKPYVQFKKLLLDTSEYLLGLIDASFESLKLYQIREEALNNWDGKRGLAFYAFGANDPSSLKKYLESQFQNMVMLKKSASPLVSFLNHPLLKDANANNELIGKWSNLVKEIELKEKGQPSSAIVGLESFISDKMNTYTIDNAEDLIKENEAYSPTENYFTEAQRNIKRMILEKVEVLTRKNSTVNYEELSSFFNKYMKGKYPFVQIQGANKVLELPPSVIKEFFKLFDKAGGSAEKILNSVYQLGDFAEENMLWLRKMEEVRNFFSNWLDGAVNLPTFDLIIDFRVNKSQEQNGQYLTDLSAKINESKIAKQDQKEPKVVRWEFNEPIAFVFGWTKGDSDPKPVANQNDPAIVVNGKEVTVNVEGNWSLLELMKRYEAQPGNYQTPNESAPYLLRFNLRQDNGQAVTIYNRVRIAQPTKSEKEAQLVYMKIPDFPFNAPELPAKVKEYEDNAYLTKQKNMWSISEKEEAATEEAATEKTEEKPAQEAAGGGGANEGQ